MPLYVAVRAWMPVKLLGGKDTLTYREIDNLDSYKVHVSKIWNREETDFTPWLSKNLDSISELTHLNLYYDNAICEKRIGRYEADIVVKNFFFAIRIEAYKIGERGFYNFVVEESPRSKKFAPDNKNYIFWHELTKLLATTDLKDKISPWGRAYIDINLEKHLFLTLSITNNISKVSIWTKDADKAEELTQKLTANPLGLRPTEGVKNPNYRGWRIEKEGRDVAWMAEKAVELYSYYNRITNQHK